MDNNKSAVNYNTDNPKMSAKELSKRYILFIISLFVLALVVE